MQTDRDLIEQAARAVAGHWDRLEASRLAEGNRVVLVNLCQAQPSRLLLRLMIAKYAALHLRAGLLAVAPNADALDLLSRRMLDVFGIRGLYPVGVPLTVPEPVRANVGQALASEGDHVRVRLNGLKVETLLHGDLFHDAFLHHKCRTHLSGPSHDLQHFVTQQVIQAGRAARLFVDQPVVALAGFDNTGPGALLARHALARGIPVLEEDGANPAGLWLRRDFADAADGPRVCAEAFEAAWRQGRRVPAAAPRPAASIPGLDPARPVVGVLAQAFCGWPHRAPLGFEDHQQWLAETIAMARQRSEVQWLVIESLEQRLFDDACNGQPFHQRGDALIREMVGDAANIRIWPAKAPLDGLAERLGALVTGHDQRGLDFATAGVPVVLAGQPAWCGLGFSIDAPSRDHFRARLGEVERLGRLDADQVARARLYRHMALEDSRRGCPLLPAFAAPAPFAEDDRRALLDGIIERAPGFMPHHDPLWHRVAGLLK